MIYKSLKIKHIICLFFLICGLSSLNAEATVESGKTIFKNYCASCHAKDMKSVLTGPALANAEANWADYPREDLYEWIKNSQGLIQQGHPRAVELWNEFKPTVMTSFPDLTNEDIESVLLHVHDVAVNGAGGASQTLQNVGTDQTPAKTSPWWYYGLFLFLGLLALLLARIINSLQMMQAEKDGIPYTGKSIWETLTSKSVVSLIIFALVLLAGYTTVNNAINLGRQQGYEPDQPIKFSHTTHAGIHKIDCQYCHDGARRSKHATIPAANTCMNCHAAIKNGSQYGTAEITKIYASIGYDPNGTGKYMENYIDMPEEDIAAIYKKWIGDQYMLANDLIELDSYGQEEVEKQWEGIVSSLTNEQKKKIGGGIEWTRIHNLPDHVYFNHSQHVTVGKVECQQCHGKVEEMDVLTQYAPLSMGWCINCHRETEVKFVGNDYYESYEKYHNELKDGTRSKVTVDEIGGLECQKCHY